MTGQRLLSDFDAGDPGVVDLERDESKDYDAEWTRRVREYAESVSAGGWELEAVLDESIWWQHPDPTSAKTYCLRLKSAGWHGYRAKRQVLPEYTEDLQDALDAAGEWMESHPLRDVESERGGNDD